RNVTEVQTCALPSSLDRTRTRSTRTRRTRRICGGTVAVMTKMRVREAATFLAVSEDTIRRWIERGALTAHTDAAGRTVLEGTEVARLARELAITPDRKSTRLNSSHVSISYAVFCLKKKNTQTY